MENQNMFFECESKISKRIAHKIFNKSDIDDIRQEVFIRFSESLKNIKNTDNLCGYLLRITDNIVIDFYRNKNKIPSHNADLENNISEKVAGIEEYTLSEIALITYINKLPEKYREALILVEINGFSQKDACQKLNISYSGLKSRVQRAREKLKEEILNCCYYKFDNYGNILSCCETKACC
jgi:RNA polymerase sigma-70 factor, ECF subfamily